MNRYSNDPRQITAKQIEKNKNRVLGKLKIIKTPLKMLHRPQVHGPYRPSQIPNPKAKARQKQGRCVYRLDFKIFNNQDNFREELADTFIRLFDLCGGLGIDIQGEIVKKCHLYKILGISGVEGYVQEGLAIAIELNDQKPKIIINKAGAELCGAKLSSKILALAKIIQLPSRKIYHAFADKILD